VVPDLSDAGTGLCRDGGNDFGASWSWFCPCSSDITD